MSVLQLREASAISVALKNILINNVKSKNIHLLIVSTAEKKGISPEIAQQMKKVCTKKEALVLDVVQYVIL